MKKLIKLIQNENIKEMKKVSTKILIIFSIISLLLAAGLVIIMDLGINLFEDSTDEYWKEFTQSDIDTTKVELSRAKENNEIEAIASAEAKIKIYQYAIDNNINITTSNQYWKVEVLKKLENEEANLYLYTAQPGIIQEKIINKQREKINQYYKILEENDFQNYIDNKINELKKQLDENEIIKEEYDNQLEILELKKKYEIGKENNSKEIWKSEIIKGIETIKEELRTNFNSSTKRLLSYEEREERENTLKIYLYRLENKIVPISQDIGGISERNYFDFMSESFSMSLIAILIIMIAGASISNECSKGTIKFLVMTPNKRWKILLAKLINAVIIMLVLTIVLSLLSLVVGSLFFGNYETQPYLYVQNEEVKSLNYTVYTIARFLTYNIDIFIYLLFALMLSVITRNTAMSIGFSIATYLGNGMIMAIINMLIKSDWIKFIPFNNMALTDKIFTNTSTIMVSQTANTMNNSVPFSLAVLGVTAILLIVTMFDSFNKRDIT